MELPLEGKNEDFSTKTNTLWDVFTAMILIFSKKRYVAHFWASNYIKIDFHWNWREWLYYRHICQMSHQASLIIDCFWTNVIAVLSVHLNVFVCKFWQQIFKCYLHLPWGQYFQLKTMTLYFNVMLVVLGQYQIN